MSRSLLAETSSLVLAAAGRRLGRVAVMALVVAAVIVVVVLASVLLVRRVRRARHGRPDTGGITVPQRGPEPTPSRGAQPAPSPEAAIAVSHLSKTYRMGRVWVAALDDVSLEIPAGAMVCVMGRSGSGKSTLLRQLGLIDTPTTGRVYLRGREVTALSERQRTGLRLSRLGYVFQEYALLPELTARENVCLPALMLGGEGRQHRERAEELLGAVGLAERAGHRPKELSGGEQQRVAIARALVNRPGIIFADEPTANLDSMAAGMVMDTLRRLNQTLGVTVLFVSHDPDDARYATRLIHLADGRVTGDGA